MLIGLETLQALWWAAAVRLTGRYREWLCGERFRPHEPQQSGRGADKGQVLLVFTRCGYGAIGMQMETSEVPGDLLLQHPHFSCVIFCVICHQWRGDVLFSHQRSASVAWMHHFQKKKKKPSLHMSTAASSELKMFGCRHAGLARSHLLVP